MDHRQRQYWRATVRVVIVCLIAWFAVSFGGGILLAEWPNRFRIGGYPLGFWFAHQGAILGFLVIIVFYVWCMNVLDRRHGVEED